METFERSIVITFAEGYHYTDSDWVANSDLASYNTAQPASIDSAREGCRFPWVLKRSTRGWATRLPSMEVDRSMWDWMRYRGQVGQWAWLLNRATGVGVLVFLLLHVVDTALIGFGPQVYDEVILLYRNPVVRVLEVVLGGAVLYHAINGVRVVLIDFWDQGARLQKPLFYGVVVVFLLTFLPTAFIMLRNVF